MTFLQLIYPVFLMATWSGLGFLATQYFLVLGPGPYAVSITLLQYPFFWLPWFSCSLTIPFKTPFWNLHLSNPVMLLFLSFVTIIHYTSLCSLIFSDVSCFHVFYLLTSKLILLSLILFLSFRILVMFSCLPNKYMDVPEAHKYSTFKWPRQPLPFPQTWIFCFPCLS